MVASGADRESPEPLLPRVGDRIGGKYEIEGVLGEGAAAVVFAARHAGLGERVAIKVLRPETARDPLTTRRLILEARAAAAIDCEHVVRVLDVDVSPHGLPFLVMERLEGADLRAVQKERGALPLDEAIDWVLQATEGVSAAHARGIVHRDLKPANLFLTRRADGTPLVKVLDFGISKANALAGLVFDESLTATAAILGSPAYMSPEQVRDAKSVDARSDVWAFGVILHQLLVDAPPFAGSTFSSLCAAIVADVPESVRARRPDVPEPVEAVLLRCLEKQPERRYSSVDALATALRAAIVTRRQPRPRRHLHVAIAAVVVALASLSIVALRMRSSRAEVATASTELPSNVPPPKPSNVAVTQTAAISALPETTTVSATPTKLPIPTPKAGKALVPVAESSTPPAPIDPLAHAQ